MGNTTEEKNFLLTLEGLIAVIGLSMTMFMAGYTIGKNSKK